MAKPKVILTPETWDWMRAYTMAVDTEIGGFGYVYSPEKGVFVVDTIYLAPQVVSSGGVHFEDGAMGFMVEQAIEDERLNDARFSWHSHVNMGVFWSNTDEDGIKDYKATGMPWLVSAVCNKKGEIKTRVDIFDSVLDHITITDCETQIGHPDIIAEMEEQVKEDIEKYVKKRTYNTSSNNQGKHRPAGTQTQPGQRQLPAGRTTSVDWWDEIDWGSVTDEQLDALMKAHGFNIEDNDDDRDASPTREEEDAARQAAQEAAF